MSYFDGYIPTSLEDYRLAGHLTFDVPTRDMSESENLATARLEGTEKIGDPPMDSCPVLSRFAEMYEMEEQSLTPEEVVQSVLEDLHRA